MLPFVERILTAVESRLGPRRAHAELTMHALWVAYDEAHAHLHWWGNVRSLVGPTVAEFGARPVMSLTRADWRKHIARRGLERGSPAQLLKRCRSMLRWAKAERMLPEALDHAWFEVPVPASPPPRRTEIDSRAIERMIDLGGRSWSAFFAVAVDTGLRTSEVLSLRWEWIDLTEGRARLPPSSVKNKEPRDVPLSARAVSRLRRLRRRPDSPWVFASPRTNRPLTRRWAHMQFKKLAEGLGVSAAPGDVSVHLHDARGTSAARVIRAGATLREVMHHLGIRSAKTADAYIQRFSGDDRARHAELVEAAAKGERVGKGKLP